MDPTLPRLRTLPFALFLLALGAAGTSLAAAPFHFGLAKSVPADKATEHHVAEVKLWFTETPADGTVSIRTLDATGAAVASSDPKQDPEDAKAFNVAFPNPLAPGQYRVNWRGMGADGHVVRDSLSFTVAGH